MNSEIASTTVPAVEQQQFLIDDTVPREVDDQVADGAVAEELPDVAAFTASGEMIENSHAKRFRQLGFSPTLWFETMGQCEKSSLLVAVQGTSTQYIDFPLEFPWSTEPVEHDVAEHRVQAQVSGEVGSTYIESGCCKKFRLKPRFILFF